MGSQHASSPNGAPFQTKEAVRGWLRPGAGASLPSYFYSSDSRLPTAACRPPASFPLNRQRPNVTLHASTEARSPVSYQAQEAASDGSLRRARGGLGVSRVPGSLCSRADKTLPHLSYPPWA